MRDRGGRKHSKPISACLSREKMKRRGKAERERKILSQEYLMALQNHV